jgi:hypothetical protein
VTIFTVDVSSHDGPIDWAAVRAAGISACCIKATEGGGPGFRYTNPLYSSQVSGARAARIPLVGAYHCLTREDVAAQLRYFLAALGGSPVPAWGMVDVEPFDELTIRGLAPTFDVVEAFCHQWWTRTNHPLTIYLPHWVWEQMGSPTLTGLPPATVLVASNYPHPQQRGFEVLYRLSGGDDGPGWAGYGGRTPDLWQYADRALVPGIRGGIAGCDVNAFRGDLTALTQLLTGISLTQLLIGTTPTKGNDDMPSGELPAAFGIDENNDWLDLNSCVAVPLPAVGPTPAQWGPAWLYLSGAGPATIRYGCYPSAVWADADVDLTRPAGPLPLPGGTTLLLLARKRPAPVVAGVARPGRWHVQYGRQIA